MPKRHARRSDLKETMATEYDISIQFNPNNPMATWSIDGKSEALITAKVGDTLSFNFVMPTRPSVELQNATLFAGPRHPSTRSSPFGSAQIQIAQGSKLTVQNPGLWGFAIAFSTVAKDGVSSFYYLPDPELEVGST